jgi:hypothetical protein
MAGTVAPSGTVAPTLSLYVGSYKVKFHALAPERLNLTRTCGINQTIRRSNVPGARRQGRPHHLGSVEPPGAAAPPRPAAPAQIGQTNHKASVTQGNTTTNGPNRSNKVDSI